MTTALIKDRREKRRHMGTRPCEDRLERDNHRPRDGSGHREAGRDRKGLPLEPLDTLIPDLSPQHVEKINVYCFKSPQTFVTVAVRH